MAKLALDAEKLLCDKETLAHGRWWRENSLVHNRLTWLLQSQGFLLAAYGAFARESPLKAAVQLVSGGVLPNPVPLGILIPVIGVAICMVIGVGIRAAWSAQQRLQDEYTRIEIIWASMSRQQMAGEFRATPCH
jgi:hypothetical protein